MVTAIERMEGLAGTVDGRTGADAASLGFRQWLPSNGKDLPTLA
jgi:hypothetical protein